MSQSRKLLLGAPSLEKNDTSLSEKIAFADAHMTLTSTEMRNPIEMLLRQSDALNDATDDVVYVSFTTCCLSMIMITNKLCIVLFYKQLAVIC